MNVRDAPLADVLRLIGQKADLKVNLDGQLEAPITGTFAGVPLEAGIRRLTRGYSSSFAYDPPPHPGQGARFSEIWVIGPDPPARPTLARARRAWQAWTDSADGGTMGPSPS